MSEGKPAPICLADGSPLEFFEGEDEFGTNELHWYAEWRCPKCAFLIRDYDDEFVFPEPPTTQQRA